MWSVLDTVSKEETLSCLILCISAWRLDNQTLETIKYYSKLFRPAFLQGNVVVLRTKLDPDSYDELNENGPDAVSKKKAEFLADLKQKVPECANISFVEIINSKIPEGKRNKLVSLLPEVDKNTVIQKANIYIHSLYARSNIIEYIFKCKPLSMVGHYFPLPPIIERKREAQLKTLEKLNEKEIETTKRYNTEHAKLLEELGKVNTDYTKCKIQLSSFRNELDRLESPIIVDKKTMSGSDWFIWKDKFVPLYSDVTFIVPVEKWRQYNCTPTSTYTPDNKGVIVKLNLPFFPGMMEWKDNLSWFAEIWLEQDGKKVNKDLITICKEKISSVKATKKQIKKSLDEKTETAVNVKTILDKSLIENTKKAENIQILSLIMYNVESIHKLQGILSLY